MNIEKIKQAMNKRNGKDILVEREIIDFLINEVEKIQENYNDLKSSFKKQTKISVNAAELVIRYSKRENIYKGKLKEIKEVLSDIENNGNEIDIKNFFTVAQDIMDDVEL